MKYDHEEESDVNKEKPLDKIQYPFKTKQKSQLIVEKMYKYSVIVMYDKLKSNDCRDGSVGSACLTLIGT